MRRLRQSTIRAPDVAAVRRLRESRMRAPRCGSCEEGAEKHGALPVRDGRRSRGSACSG